MTRVCFIRHGQTDWNILGKYQGREDIPLNSTGEQQAAAAGKYLSRFQWEAILTSPLSRAQKTARIIGSFCGIEPLVCEDFIERDFGEASGMTWKEQHEKYPDNIPDRETEAQMAVRIGRGLATILKNYPDKNVIVVSHGAAIRFILKFLSDGKIDLIDNRVKNMCFNIAEWN